MVLVTEGGGPRDRPAGISRRPAGLERRRIASSSRRTLQESGTSSLVGVDRAGGRREADSRHRRRLLAGAVAGRRAIFFLEMTARGVDLRRLPLPGEASGGFRPDHR